ncbi:MAG: mechanosensitive ion channel family protein [Synergistaceae bacterium]|nr:mechanosensitive ion channel family protein [Synergistaceae bacterium]
MSQVVSFMTTIFKEFKVLFLVLLFCVVWFLLDKFARYMIKRLFRIATENIPTDEEGSTKETLIQRLVTLRQLAIELVRALIAVFFIFYLLKILGFNLGPVLAGVGVVGLGVSFAAQNLIRDYINGIIILTENQYNIGDVIEVNDLVGTVEKFNLRATRLRDFTGSLIIIPNSLIQTVLNKTKLWSATIVKIGITYDSDYQKAVSLMSELAKTMFNEPDSGIIELPKAQGILEFSANSVDLRVFIKTIPGRQWEVSWAYRARLKDMFDKEGVKFATPRMIVQGVDSQN